MPLSGWLAWSPSIFFFRKANLLPPSRDKFDEHLHLRRSDLHLFSWGVVMVVRWNKTIQFKQRTLLIPLPRVNESPLCPLRALSMLMIKRERQDPPRDKTGDAYLQQLSAKINIDFKRCGFKYRAISRPFV